MNRICASVARSGLRVQRLQLLHGFEAQRRGRVVQPQQVGRDIHHHRALRRVAGRHAGKQLAQRRGRQARQRVHHARALADAQNAQPQRHHADQPDGNVKARARRIEHRRQQLREHLQVPHRQPSQRHGEGADEEGQPDEVQEHGRGGGAGELSAVRSILPDRAGLWLL
jgi:hypothetical protein